MCTLDIIEPPEEKQGVTTRPAQVSIKQSDHKRGILTLPNNSHQPSAAMLDARTNSMISNTMVRNAQQGFRRKLFYCKRSPEVRSTTDNRGPVRDTPLAGHSLVLRPSQRAERRIWRPITRFRPQAFEINRRKLPGLLTLINSLRMYVYLHN
jgi:hypothetical protein